MSISGPNSSSNLVRQGSEVQSQGQQVGQCGEHSIVSGAEKKQASCFRGIWTKFCTLFSKSSQGTSPHAQHSVSTEAKGAVTASAAKVKQAVTSRGKRQAPATPTDVASQLKATVIRHENKQKLAKSCCDRIQARWAKEEKANPGQYQGVQLRTIQWLLVTRALTGGKDKTVSQNSTSNSESAAPLTQLSQNFWNFAREMEENGDPDFVLALSTIGIGGPILSSEDLMPFVETAIEQSGAKSASSNFAADLSALINKVKDYEGSNPEIAKQFWIDFALQGVTVAEGTVQGVKLSDEDRSLLNPGKEIPKAVSRTDPSVAENLKDLQTLQQVSIPAFLQTVLVLASEGFYGPDTE